MSQVQTFISNALETTAPRTIILHLTPDLIAQKQQIAFFCTPVRVALTCVYAHAPGTDRVTLTPAYKSTYLAEMALNGKIDPDRLNADQRKLVALARGVAASVSGDDYNKALALHDYLAKNVRYSKGGCGQ